MKRKALRIGSLLLAMVMLFGMIPAFAAEELVPAETAEIPAAGKTGEAPAAVPAPAAETDATTISSASITLDAPAIGASPDYTAVFPKGAYYYSGPYNETPYQNDIAWWDVTNGSSNVPVYPNTGIFEDGHVYRVEIYLTAQNGYSFSGSTTATVNEYTAETSLYQEQLRVVYTFPVLSGLIPSVSITLDAPAIGARPDYTAVFPSGAHYYSDTYQSDIYYNDIRWFDATDGTQNSLAWNSSIVFEAGHRYGVTVYLTAEDGYAFSSETTAALNGNSINPYIVNNQLCIEHTFPALPDEYTVTFDANGGTFADGSTQKTLRTINGGYFDYDTYTAQIGEPDACLTREGWHTFTNVYGNYYSRWHTAQEGGSMPSFSSSTKLSGDRTYYAQWTKEVTITFDANGGTFGDGAVTRSVTTKKGLFDRTLWEQTIYWPRYSTAGLTREGYSILGNEWYCSPNNDDTSSYTLSASWRPSEDMTLYCHWGRNYTVTFDGNGGLVGRLSSSFPLFPLLTDETPALSAEDPAEPAASNAAPAASAANTGADVSPQDAGSAPAAGIGAEDPEIWGGEQLSETMTVTGVGKVDTCYAVRSGYTFVGWYTKKTGGTLVADREVVSFEPSAATSTVYAHWTASSTLEITHHPDQAEGYVGNTVDFYAAANGTGLQYRWQVGVPHNVEVVGVGDGIQALEPQAVEYTWSNVPSTVSGYNTSHLRVTITPDLDLCAYRCRVTNGNGDVVYSDPARLEVEVHITKNPDSFYGKATDTAVFTVEATGAGLHYQWYEVDYTGYHEVAIDGAVSPSYSVKVSEASEYGYFCRIDADNGSSISTGRVYARVGTPITAAAVTVVGAVVGAKKADFNVTVPAGKHYSAQPGFEGDWVYRLNGALQNISTQELFSQDLIYSDDVQSLGADDALTPGTYLGTAVLDADEGYGFMDPAVTVNISDDITTNCFSWSSGSGAIVYFKFTVAAPQITEQPRDVTALAGDDAYFRVEVSAIGAAYQWQYKKPTGDWTNCGSFPGYNTDTMTVPVTTARNGYQFRCMVTYDGTTLTSNAAALTVASEFAIISQPQSVTALAGDSVTFRVGAAGSSGVSYQWQYLKPSGSWTNCGSFAGCNTAEMTVPVTTARNGYKFRCKVTRLGTTLTSSAATLTVASAFAITQQPQNVTAPAGGNVQFHVGVNATSSVTYQWQYKKPSGSWTNLGSFTGYNTDTLTVPVTTARNGYLYRCEVTRGGTTLTSDAATLTVGTALSITQQPQNATAPAGGNVQFHVGVNAASGVTYQWQYLKPGGSWTNCGSFTGYNTATVTVPVTTARDGYQFRCVITSGSQSVTSSAATLTVGAALSITTQPGSKTGVVGKNVQFKVVLSSTAGVTYQWQYLKPSGSWTNCSSFTGYNTAAVTVPVTEARNGYKFRCVITKGSTTLTSNAATLTVFAITAQPANVTAAAGTDATFSVTARGSGVTYQWQYKKPSGSWTNCSSFAGYNTKTLTVPATTARNGYKFRCVVTCQGTNITSSAATLTVGSAALSITTQPGSKTGVVGKNVQFKVVLSSTTGVTYQWQYLKPSGSWTNCGSFTGYNTATVTVPVTEARNGYKFRCVITKGSTTLTSNAATLTVFAITAQPQNKTAAAGTDATFTVTVRGTGVTYQWQYKKPSGSWTNCSSFTGYNTKTLTVPATTARNGYQFRCVVTCQSTDITSSAATLTVN